MPVEGSELGSDHPSASNKTQQQPNAVVQGKELREANETAAGNQKRKLLLSFLQDPSETKFLIQGNPYPHGIRKKETGAPRVVPKRKQALKRLKSGPKEEVVDMGRLFAQHYF